MDEVKSKTKKSPYSKIKSLEHIVESKDLIIGKMADEAMLLSKENTLLKQEILKLKTEISNTKINYNNVCNQLDKIPNWIKKFFK